MLKIRYAVCDDDGMICDAVSDRVCAILEKYGLTVFCERFTSPDALCRRFRDGEVPYDLLFLDIDMPGMSGLNLAKIVRQKVGEKIDIVFVSNREDQVFEAFGVHPFGFVRKSNFTRDLTDTLRSYMDLRVKSDSCLAIQTQNNSVTRQLQISDIVYIESYRYHQIIYMTDGEEIKIRLTMEELENKLREYNVIRIHKGYLVNLKYVQRIDRSGVVVQFRGGVVLNVSRDKLQDVKVAYLNYLRNTGAVTLMD
ncbi:MAG: response regulator transcription factor [Lachnospiraceae bacterium]|nr:response regulator transcription factor [Lachnospiraceae bacterium]